MAAPWNPAPKLLTLKACFSHTTVESRLQDQFNRTVAASVAIRKDSRALIPYIWNSIDFTSKKFRSQAPTRASIQLGENDQSQTVTDCLDPSKTTILSFSSATSALIFLKTVLTSNLPSESVTSRNLMDYSIEPFGHIDLEISAFDSYALLAENRQYFAQ
eukprot:Gb_23121 [translate_table: standard]